ncbi:unnamed protein product, partial [Timema podura]|nr:unnamed protein product [Timema podura]
DVTMNVSHSSLMSSDIMKPKSRDWVVAINFLQEVVINSLSRGSNVKIYLRKTITSDSGIRSQDISSVYPSVYNNVYGVDFAINFLSQNFRDIIEFNASVSSVVSGIAGAISSQEQLDKRPT